MFEEDQVRLFGLKTKEVCRTTYGTVALNKRQPLVRSKGF